MNEATITAQAVCDLHVSAIDLLLKNTLTGLYLKLALVEGTPPAVLERTRLSTLLAHKAAEAPEGQAAE